MKIHFFYQELFKILLAKTQGLGVGCKNKIKIEVHQ
jgi:hypothetical protein